jgi:uncharacterized membrane protein YjgN (DUF898 family)
MSEDIVIPIAGMIMTIVIVLGLAVPWIRHRIRMAEQPMSLRAAGHDDPRLERMEQAIDAMAIELERISEGQRFVTRLLSERSPETAKLPSDRRQSA